VSNYSLEMAILSLSGMMDKAKLNHTVVINIFRLIMTNDLSRTEIHHMVPIYNGIVKMGLGSKFHKSEAFINSIIFM